MSLEITYFAEGRNKGIYGVPILSVAVSDGSASPAIPISAEVVRIKALAATRFAYGTDPVATGTAGANGHYIAQGDIIDIQAVPGWKIAAAAAA
jgi:hypothetical protein